MHRSYRRRGAIAKGLYFDAASAPVVHALGHKLRGYSILYPDSCQYNPWVIIKSYQNRREPPICVPNNRVKIEPKRMNRALNSDGNEESNIVKNGDLSFRLYRTNV